MEMPISIGQSMAGTLTAPMTVVDPLPFRQKGTAQCRTSPEPVPKHEQDMQVRY
jgi:hypothetical protein